MKLYTRGQMILVSVAVFVLTVGIMVFVGFKTVNAVVSRQTQVIQQEVMLQLETGLKIQPCLDCLRNKQFWRQIRSLKQILLR